MATEIGSPHDSKNRDAQSQVVPHPGIRYRPMLWNAALALSLYTFLWTWPDLQGGHRVIGTFVTISASGMWFLIWLVFRSRIPARPKWTVLASIILVMLAAALSIRIKGYSGDLIPILSWRWSPQQVFDKSGIKNPSVSNSPIFFEPGPHDTPGFFGPRRDGVYPRLELQENWDSKPPKEIWRQSLGDSAGHSSFAVVGQILLTQQQDGDNELVVCYDLSSGVPLWNYSYPSRYDSSFGRPGPRATPTIDGPHTYTFGALGILNCLNLSTGSLVWTRDVPIQHEASALKWGNSCSPLIVDDIVIVSTGQKKANADSRRFATLVAYNKFTGDRVWSAGRDEAGYCSPVLATLGGAPQIVVVNANSVTGHDPASGTILWEKEWPGGRPNVSQPVLLTGDRVLFTKGYSEGAALWQINHVDNTWSVEEIWRNHRVMKTKFTSAIVYQGHAYGLSDGFLECIKVDSGQRCWKARADYGHGQVIRIGDRLLVQCESGQVALVAPNPGKHIEITRFTPLSDCTWNYPVVVGNLLLVRNDRELACFELPLRPMDES